MEPSGCGRSTAYAASPGEEITGGSIFIDDEDVTSKEPKDRNIAMVFQNYALYPHMNVFDNITYRLKIAHSGGGRAQSAAPARGRHRAPQAPTDGLL